METQALTPQVAPHVTPHVAPTFYHGTSKASHGEAILRDGCLRAASREELDARYGKSFQRPVDGRIYLTTSLQYATVYALGGYLMGSDHVRQSAETDPDGYVFSVEADVASMLADEDSLGSIPSLLLRDIDWAPASGHGLDQAEFINFCLLYPEFRASLSRQVARCLTPHVAKKAGEGVAVWQSKAGKALIRGLSPAMLEILTFLFPHRSAPGPLRVTAAWKLPKSAAKLVSPDCANLFEVATRVA